MTETSSSIEQHCIKTINHEFLCTGKTFNSCRFFTTQALPLLWKEQFCQVYLYENTVCQKSVLCHKIPPPPPSQEVATVNLWLTIQNEQEIQLHFCLCLMMSDLDCTPQLLSKPLPQELDLIVSLTLNISANLHFSIALSAQCRFADRYRHFKRTCCHHTLPCR